jgi:hypothetical protein
MNLYPRLAAIAAFAVLAPLPALARACDWIKGAERATVQLFFGHSIPGGGTVAETEWQDFLATSVTPRFPGGLTVLDGHGQWFEQKSHQVITEVSTVVEIVIPADRGGLQKTSSDPDRVHEALPPGGGRSRGQQRLRELPSQAQMISCFNETKSAEVMLRDPGRFFHRDFIKMRQAFDPPGGGGGFVRFPSPMRASSPIARCGSQAVSIAPPTHSPSESLGRLPRSRAESHCANIRSATFAGFLRRGLAQPPIGCANRAMRH